MAPKKMVNRRAIIITFIVVEVVMLLLMVCLAAWLEKAQTPLSNKAAHPLTDTLEVSIIAPDIILWDQDDPVPIIVNLHIIENSQPAGEAIKPSLKCTAAATIAQTITPTIAATTIPTSTTPAEVLFPFWLSVDNPLLLAVDDGSDTLAWAHQVEIDPNAHGFNIKLFIRRVTQDSVTPDHTTGNSKTIPLDIRVESKCGAAWRRGLKHFVELGPLPLTLLIAATGVWLDYQRQRDEQSRKKLEELQKLSREMPGTVDLLEAFLFHSQRVSESSISLTEEFNQLGKAILVPDNLLTALSSAYEESFDTGESLLKKIVDFCSPAGNGRQNPPQNRYSALDGGEGSEVLRKLQVIAEPSDPDPDKTKLLDKLKQVLALWDTHKFTTHGFVIHNILQICQELPEGEKKPAFRDKFNDKGRRQLILHPLLMEIEKIVPKPPWYDGKAFPFSDIFSSSPEWQQKSSISKIAPPGENDPSPGIETDLEKQRHLLGLLKGFSPFSDHKSPFYLHSELIKNAWTEPTEWETLTQLRDTPAERHILLSSEHTWDVHAALCIYAASFMELAEKNRAFPVPLRFRAYSEYKEEGQGALKMVLLGLAEGWAGLLAAQPVAFLNLHESEKMFLMELGTWAAGSFSAWENWLWQKAKAFELGADDRVLGQLFKRMAAYAEQIEKIPHQVIIPSQADNWLRLRPARLFKTYLVFTLPNPIDAATQKAAAHKELAAFLELAQSALSRYQIYLRGFVQTGYLPKSLENMISLPLEWSDFALLKAIESRFEYFRGLMKPQKPVFNFGNLFKERSAMEMPPNGGDYPYADLRLVEKVGGSLGRLVGQVQSLIDILTENDDIDYLEEAHIESLERNDLDESA